MNQCSLARELRRLKESSKEAVECIESFSDFKKYMHVERNVEIELADLLHRLNQQNIKKQLVLICGSVGDGKSHVISQIKNCRGNLLDGFMIHNDATESNHPNKTYLQTLDEKFEPFSDENIDKDENYKLIVAINLGTLSNFIEAAEYLNKYSILREYVMTNKIIENELAVIEESQYISYINFSDYALYELTENGPKSNFIENILDKIVIKSESNSFYAIYKNQCNQNCPYTDHCPVKYNYELLFNSALKIELSKNIISGIVKHKVILSVRSLLDFIFSIIVPNNFEKFSDGKQLDQYFKDNSAPELLIKTLMPNLLYDQPQKSPLSAAIYSEDPLNDRTELIDQLIIDVNISREPTKQLKLVFEDANYSVLHQLFSNIPSEQVDNKVLVTTYLRYAKLFDHEIVNNMGHYDTYMTYLYHYHNRNIQEYSQLYKDIMRAIYLWNGRNDEPWINISVTGQKSDYTLSHELKIEPIVISTDRVLENNKCSKFSTDIRLSLRNKGASESVEFIVDFDLYQLIMKVRKGYRLNHNDKENYISFIESIERLMSFGEMKEALRITHKKNRYKLDYTLKKDMFGGYIFESN
ncbi:MAG: DNA phosphorothioation-dependent restriction protein DptF [Candidatus Delongbacteria bacterium]|nr:DNA phosphorothioation-dependent restriction protein DptF [Candidatus Delongbacteria bacterium]